MPTHLTFADIEDAVAAAATIWADVAPYLFVGDDTFKIAAPTMIEVVADRLAGKMPSRTALNVLATALEQAGPLIAKGQSAKLRAT